MAAKLMKKIDQYLTLHKFHELAANGKIKLLVFLTAGGK